MIGHVTAYLIGMVLGELGLLALWFQKQAPGATVKQYVQAKKGAALLSGVVALAGCMVWAEGGLIRYIGEELTLTLGYSVLAGFVAAMFAHSVIAIFAKRTGLEPPKED
jgi:hypothetical protein